MATATIFIQPIPIFLHKSIKLNAYSEYTKFHKDLLSSYWEKCILSFSNLIRFHGNGGHFEFFFIGKHFYSWWVTILWSFIEFGWAVSKKLRGQFHWRRRIRICDREFLVCSGHWLQNWICDSALDCRRSLIQDRWLCRLQTITGYQDWWFCRWQTITG